MRMTWGRGDLQNVHFGSFSLSKEFLLVLGNIILVVISDVMDFCKLKSAGSPTQGCVFQRSRNVFWLGYEFPDLRIWLIDVGDGDE